MAEEKTTSQRPQKREFNRSGSRPDFNRRPRREAPVQEEKVWVPKTTLGKDILSGKR